MEAKVEHWKNMILLNLLGKTPEDIMDNAPQKRTPTTKPRNHQTNQLRVLAGGTIDQVQNTQL